MFNLGVIISRYLFSSGSSFEIADHVQIEKNPRPLL